MNEFQNGNFTLRSLSVGGLFVLFALHHIEEQRQIAFHVAGHEEMFADVLVAVLALRSGSAFRADQL